MTLIGNKMSGQAIMRSLDSKLICTPFVPIKGQLADMLTNRLNENISQSIISKLEIENIYSPTSGNC